MHFLKKNIDNNLSYLVTETSSAATAAGEILDSFSWMKKPTRSDRNRIEQYVTAVEPILLKIK